MPAERRRSFLRAVLITGGIGLFFFLLILGVGFLLAHREQLGGPKVALVEVDGIIEDSKRVVDQ
ncbi:MAG: hypothetical protein U9R33_04900, partial [candidate division NC10 bacterium]|nr:hypothetical protein [candidate division NC10 bacterium]